MNPCHFDKRECFLLHNRRDIFQVSTRSDQLLLGFADKYVKNLKSDTYGMKYASNTSAMNSTDLERSNEENEKLVLGFDCCPVDTDGRER